ncbi:MAG: tyrosine-type recombinase/integrase [Sphingobium sp.]
MLTELKVKAAKPAERDYKLSDDRGLYLYVTTKGYKSWRLKYRFNGKEGRLVFGPWPEVSLSEARDKRDEARRELRDGRDPSVSQKKRKMLGDAGEASFEKVARRWHESQKGRWAPIHADDVIHSLERDIFPKLGRLPVGEIDVPTTLAVLRSVEDRGSVDTAKRLRQRMSAVFSFAIAEGICESDPASVVTKALKPINKKKRQPAITDLAELQKLLIKAEESGASPVTKLASRLLALTAVRPGVIRGTSWDEFEGVNWDAEPCTFPDDAIWRIPAQRMKLIADRKEDEQFEHIVPLSRQAIEVLYAMRPLTKRTRYVFPGVRHSHRSISENAIGYLYNRIGYHGRHVPHGWRAAFSTIMNEKAEREGRPGDRAIIDLMLAHVPPNTVEGSYNRAAYMERRRELAQEWADLLCKPLIAPANLLKLQRR